MQKSWQRWCMLLALVMGLTVSGCAQTTADPSSTSANRSPAGQVVASAAMSMRLRPTDFAQLKGKATIQMVVNGSPITIEVDGDAAPVTAGNFVDLVQRGVYDGLVFHRVVREPQPFVVQGGDPQSKNPGVPPEQLGTGSFIDPATSQPRYIPLEIKPQGEAGPIYHQTFDAAGITAKPKLRHIRGAVAMARSAVPDSASSQFYFTLADLAFLDGNYAVFGYVTEGMDGVDKIKQGDRIESAKVIKSGEALQPAPEKKS